MKGKIKGCTHHETKVLKMAGGGAVPNKYSKKLPYMMAEPKSKRTKMLETSRNPDGSQQYVKGETLSEKMKTLSRVSDATLKMSRKAQAEVNRTFDRPEGEPFDGKKYDKASAERDKAWAADDKVNKTFLDEFDRKYKK